MLQGAGVKGKVNQAMKFGVPVVATPLAVEGMHAQDGRDVLVGRNSDEFAQKLVDVYKDCELWQRIVKGGYANIRDHFSTEKARPVVLHAFKSVGAGPRRRADRAVCEPL